VTGALQYWTRAIVVGEKTYGKGSVQTIIQLRKPANSALRLTTALYYTPAEVTINKHGILPDVDAPMSKEDKFRLFMQMRRSQSSDPAKKDQQNHGSVSGDPVSDTTTEDTQLKKAVDIILEDGVFENLVKKYHKDTHVTQVAASDAKETKDPEPKESVEVLPVEAAP
jgi:carboxyl-terminal processing protease